MRGYDGVTEKTDTNPFMGTSIMTRTSILAIITVAVLGSSCLVPTDAPAFGRFGLARASRAPAISAPRMMTFSRPTFSRPTIAARPTFTARTSFSWHRWSAPSQEMLTTSHFPSGQASFHSDRSAAQFNSSHLSASKTSENVSIAKFNGQRANTNLEVRFQNSGQLNSIYSTSKGNNGEGGAVPRPDGGAGSGGDGGRTPPGGLTAIPKFNGQPSWIGGNANLQTPFRNSGQLNPIYSTSTGYPSNANLSNSNSSNGNRSNGNSLTGGSGGVAQPGGRGAGSGGSGDGVPASGQRPYVPDEVVVELAGNPLDGTFDMLAVRHRLTRLDMLRADLTNSTWVRWRITDRRSVPAVIRALAADSSIRSVQPNYLFALGQGASTPGETAAGNIQYALDKLHLPEAQTLARGRKVTVAVIDTEIDTSHPELAGAVTESFDSLRVSSDMEAHGTQIAGTIAAHARLVGAAPDVHILAVRAFAGGKGSTFSIVKGLDWAVARGARIINMSFAGPSDPALARAIAAAHDKGRILIAAAGNQGPKSSALYPAADPHVIAVTATDANDRLFAMASGGRHVAIAAPGVDILVPTVDNRYVMSSGTSFASAYVSGVAALLAERRPDITPDAVKNVLMSTARHLGATPRDDQFGAGLMDANQAVLSLSSPAQAMAGPLSH
jgi:Subtilase family